jgi:CDP-diacylglycerol--glycerol-3-phosphate 3-phosphatidyltransferase
VRAVDLNEKPVRSSYKERLKHGAHAVVDPVVRRLIWLGIGADHLTVLGLLLSMASGYAFFDGQFRIAAGILILAGLCDILDGQVARVSGRQTVYGAFLDSTLDRLAEAFVLLGLTCFYATNLWSQCIKARALVGQVASGEVEPFLATPILTRDSAPAPETYLALTLVSVLALIASFMVSYTRARAEGLGLECKVGFFERPERIVLLIIAGLVGTFKAMSGALLILTIMSIITAGQRMQHVYRVTRTAAMDSENTEA